VGAKRTLAGDCGTFAISEQAPALAWGGRDA